MKVVRQFLFAVSALMSIGIVPGYAVQLADGLVDHGSYRNSASEFFTDKAVNENENSNGGIIPVLAHFTPEVRVDTDLASPVGELEKWRARVSSNGFLAEESALLSRDGEEPNADVSNDLAYFYFSQGLMPEALKIIEAVPADHRSLGLTVLQAAAHLKLGRPRRAFDVLNEDSIKSVTALAPWRAIALTHIGAFKSAGQEFNHAETVTVPFEDFAAIFFLTEAQTQYELGDERSAHLALDKLRTRQLTPEARAERRLLEARLIASTGRTNTAAPLTQNLSERPVDRITIEAKLDILRRNVTAGRLSADQALDRLSAMALTWKGDASDRSMLQYRIELLDATGRKIEALGVRREIVMRFPRSDLAKLTAEQIRQVLPSLMDDPSILPSAAATAFYENLDFAPPGYLGDVLIENTADTLIELDLLAESAELLRHQTFERLRGVDRARVGAKLAQVYLALGAPDDALATLMETRLTRIPDALAYQRDIVEAKALFNRGQADDALETLAGKEEGEGLLLRATIHADKGDLEKAAALNVAWLNAREGFYTALENQVVIRTAAFYATLGDDQSLATLKDTLMDKVTEPSTAELFRSITTTDFEQAGADYAAHYRAFFTRNEASG